MSEFTNKGVVTKTLDEWYDSVVAFKRAVWGEDFVTDPTTKQGADVLQLAELLYNAEMNNVSAFAQLNLNTATGICLDYIGLVRGIQRDGGYPQQILVDLTSSVTGYTVTPSVTFKTVTGYTYYTPVPIEITAFAILPLKEKKIKYADLLKRLKMICENELVLSTLKSYPWYRLPVKQAAFAFAMKHQLFLLQRLMVILRDR